MGKSEEDQVLNKLFKLVSFAYSKSFHSRSNKYVKSSQAERGKEPSKEMKLVSKYEKTWINYCWRWWSKWGILRGSLYNWHSLMKRTVKPIEHIMDFCSKTRTRSEIYRSTREQYYNWWQHIISRYRWTLLVDFLENPKNFHMRTRHLMS